MNVNSKIRLKKELNRLWSGEFASVIIFGMVYFEFYLLWSHKHTIQVIYPLFLLCFVLLQGSLYWLICLKRFCNDRLFYPQCWELYSAFKYIDMFLIIAYVVVILFAGKIEIGYYLEGISIYLFAIVEYINYFFYRLSYKSISILFKQLKDHCLIKSRIAREIEKSRLCKKRA